MLAMVTATNLSAQGSTVAYVEVQKILAKSSRVKLIEKKMKREFSKREEEIVNKGKELERLQQKYKKDSVVMTEKEIKRLERDIITRGRDLKNMQSEFKEDFVLRRNEELGKLQKEIREVITTIAKEEKIDMVFETAVVFYSNKVDITDKVLRRMK